MNDNTEMPVFVEFILDETGSMGKHARSAIRGFAQYIRDQRETASPMLCTLTKFKSSELMVPYEDLPIAYVPDLTRKTYLPDGTTNLFDAIGARVTALRTRIEGMAARPHCLVVVLTDGEDNSSHRYDRNAIRQLIEEASEDGITFVYLGADQHAQEIAGDLGFMSGNILSYASEQTEATMALLSEATTVYRTTRSAVAAPSADFFSATN